MPAMRIQVGKFWALSLARYGLTREFNVRCFFEASDDEIFMPELNAKYYVEVLNTKESAGIAYFQVICLADC
jgi:hypothetical protein